MAIEGLEIAPGGIGSGEAQIFKTPFTERAFMMKNEQERLRKAQEEEQFANELAKIDVNGIHSPDAEDINKQYQELIDIYANVRNAKGRNERLKNKVIYEQKKKDLLMNIGSSKAYSKNLLNVGEKMLGSPEEWEENARERYRQLKEGKSFGVTIDETQFRKKAKPADVIKIKNDIISSATSTQQKAKGGMVDGSKGFINETTSTLDPLVYTDNWVAILRSNPEMKNYLIDLYKKNYEDTDQYKKEGDKGFLGYAINQEFAKDSAIVAKNKKAPFTPAYVPNNNSFNFGGSSIMPSTIQGWDTPVTSTITTEVTKEANSSMGKGSVTTKKVIPVIKEQDVNIVFETTASEGYMRNGVYVKPQEQMKINGAKIVVLPVYKTKDGYEFADAETEITATVGKQTSKTKRKDKSYDKNKVFNMAFVEGKDEYGERSHIPLAAIPQDRIQAADRWAFLSTAPQGTISSFSQIGRTSNNTSTPQGRVR